MCGLIYHNGEVWNEIIKKNLERAGTNKGAFTFTPTFIDERDAALTALGVISTFGASEEIDTDSWESGVFHMQAPTSEHSRPHPAKSGKWLVWHNGILKQKEIDKHAPIKWDTEVLAHLLDKFGAAGLAGLDGSFACIAYNRTTKRLIAFRNRLAPLFTNGSSLSSVRIDESWWALESNCVYLLNVDKWEMTSYKFEDCIVPFEGLK